MKNSKYLILTILVVVVLSFSIVCFSGCDQNQFAGSDLFKPNVFKGIDTKSGKVFGDVSLLLDTGVSYEALIYGGGEYSAKIVVNENRFLYKTYYGSYQEFLFALDDNNNLNYYTHSAFDESWEYKVIPNGGKIYEDNKKVLLEKVKTYLKTANEITWGYSKEDKVLFTNDGKYTSVGRNNLQLDLLEGNMLTLYNVNEASPIYIPGLIYKNEQLIIQLP